MDVETDFFAGGGPVLVAEAVFEFAVLVGVEAVVTGGDAAFVDEVFAGWIKDLESREDSISNGRGMRESKRRVFVNALSTSRGARPPWDGWGGPKIGILTQKSISKFPAPPNSLSPTWKVTVILSSLCSCS